MPMLLVLLPLLMLIDYKFLFSLSLNFQYLTYRSLSSAVDANGVVVMAVVVAVASTAITIQ